MKMQDMILVSVDDHLVEPADMFKNQLSGTLLESAPRLASEGERDFWVYGERISPNIAMNAVAGRPPEEYGYEPNSLRGMRRGCWDVHERVKDMDANGILGSICFASFVGMDGALFLGHPDKRQALEHLKAYNNWHVDEWCGAYPGRFIPLGLLPLWDVGEMVKEVERLTAKGCHTVSFPDNPTYRRLPSLHDPIWRPFWEAVSANNVVINCHIGTGNQPAHPSPQSPIEVWTTVFPMAIAVGAADWLHLEALRKYNLQVSLTEGGIGWIPYLLERADYTHARHKAWTHSNFNGRKPSEVFREHFYTCFIEDEFGLANLARLNEDRVCYECDFPHSDSVWPESPEYLHKTLGNLPDETINKITHLNAMRAHSYDPFTHFVRADCTVGALRARARAAGVDTKPIRVGGAAKPLGDDEKRVVTSGDVTRLFSSAA